jgi:hypothetical protein
MNEGGSRVSIRQDPPHPGAVLEMSGDEAVFIYQEWRNRVIGSRKTKADTMDELYAQLRDVPVTSDRPEYPPTLSCR